MVCLSTVRLVNAKSPDAEPLWMNLGITALHALEQVAYTRDMPLSFLRGSKSSRKPVNVSGPSACFTIPLCALDLMIADVWT